MPPTSQPCSSSDLNDSKRVNDRYGHCVGDEVLAGTAVRLASSVRAEDLVARIGGDEFAVLFERVPVSALLDEIAGRIARTTDVEIRSSRSHTPRSRSSASYVSYSAQHRSRCARLIATFRPTRSRLA